MQVVSAEPKTAEKAQKTICTSINHAQGGSLSTIGGSVFLFDIPNVKKGQVGFLLCFRGAADVQRRSIHASGASKFTRTQYHQPPSTSSSRCFHLY